MSTKATPDLGLPSSKEAQSFRALEQILKNDQVLGRTITKFVAWRGEDDDLYDVDKDIVHTMCPFLKISPWPNESDWVTESQHQMDLMIRISVAVRGTKVDNLLNFWNAIRLAIFPQSSIAASQAVQAVLRGPNQNLVQRAALKMSAYGVIVDETNARMLRADGLIRLGLLIGT